MLHQRWQFTPARRAVLAVRRALCMIDPMVEEVGLRRMPVAVAVASLTAVAGLLAVTTAVLANGDAAAAALTVSGRPPNVWRAGSRVGSAWRLTAACRPSGTWKGIRQCPA